MTTMTSTETHTVPSGATLRTLAWQEVRRYARHPLFLVSLILLVLTTAVDAAREVPVGTTSVDVPFAAMVLIGLIGTVVAYRLAKSMDAAAEVTDATPVPRATRTAALCLATLFPAAVGAIAIAATALISALRWPELPYLNSGMASSTILVASLAGVVTCAGGPLFGILVARWTDFPGAGVLAAVALVAWTLAGTSGLAMAEASRVSALIVQASPAAFWTSADAPGATVWQVEGAPLAHLAYVITLCLLGATLAIVRDAEGDQRRRLWRLFAVLVVVAVVALGLTALPDPVRIPLNVTE